LATGKRVAPRGEGDALRGPPGREGSSALRRSCRSRDPRSIRGIRCCGRRNHIARALRPVWRRPTCGTSLRKPVAANGARIRPVESCRFVGRNRADSGGIEGVCRPVRDGEAPRKRNEAPASQCARKAFCRLHDVRLLSKIERSQTTATAVPLTKTSDVTRTWLDSRNCCNATAVVGIRRSCSRA